MKIIDKLKRRKAIAEAKVKFLAAQVNLAETLKALDFTSSGIVQTIAEAVHDPDDAFIQVQIQFASSPEEIEELSAELHTLFDLVEGYMEEAWEAAEEINRLKRKNK